MEDPLKKHIEGSREAFDPYVPDADALWEGISAQLDAAEPKRVALWGWAWKAAAVMALALGLGWAALPQTGGIAQQQDRELQETQQFYAEAIQEKMQALEARRDAVDDRIFEDLEALDAALAELKADLKDRADNEEVVNAMIRNYQIKLKILEEILEQLKHENGSQERMEDPAA